jgi:hypothetical protein
LVTHNDVIDVPLILLLWSCLSDVYQQQQRRTSPVPTNTRLDEDTTELASVLSTPHNQSLDTLTITAERDARESPGKAAV